MLKHFKVQNNETKLHSRDRPAMKDEKKAQICQEEGRSQKELKEDDVNTASEHSDNLVTEAVPIKLLGGAKKSKKIPTAPKKKKVPSLSEDEYFLDPEEDPNQEKYIYEASLEEYALYNVAKELVYGEMIDLCFEAHRELKVGYYPHYESVLRKGKCDFIEEKTQLDESTNTYKCVTTLIKPECPPNDSTRIDIVEENIELDESTNKHKCVISLIEAVSSLKSSDLSSKFVQEQRVPQVLTENKFPLYESTNLNKPVKVLIIPGTRPIDKNILFDYYKEIKPTKVSCNTLMKKFTKATEKEEEKRSTKKIDYFKKPKKGKQPEPTEEKPNRIQIKPVLWQYRNALNRSLQLKQSTLDRLKNILSKPGKTFVYEELVFFENIHLENSQKLDSEGLTFLEKSTSEKYRSININTTQMLKAFATAWDMPLTIEKMKILSEFSKFEYRPLESETFEEVKMYIIENDEPADVCLLKFLEKKNKKLHFRTMQEIKDFAAKWGQPLDTSKLDLLQKATTRNGLVYFDKKTFEILIDHEINRQMPLDQDTMDIIKKHVCETKKPLDLRTLANIKLLWTPKQALFNNAHKKNTVTLEFFKESYSRAIAELLIPSKAGVENLKKLLEKISDASFSIPVPKENSFHEKVVECEKRQSKVKITNLPTQNAKTVMTKNKQQKYNKSISKTDVENENKIKALKILNKKSNKKNNTKLIGMQPISKKAKKQKTKLESLEIYQKKIEKKCKRLSEAEILIVLEKELKETRKKLKLTEKKRKKLVLIRETDKNQTTKDTLKKKRQHKVTSKSAKKPEECDKNPTEEVKPKKKKQVLKEEKETKENIVSSKISNIYPKILLESAKKPEKTDKNPTEGDAHKKKSQDLNVAKETTDNNFSKTQCEISKINSKRASKGHSKKDQKKPERKQILITPSEAKSASNKNYKQTTKATHIKKRPNKEGNIDSTGETIRYTYRQAVILATKNSLKPLELKNQTQTAPKIEHCPNEVVFLEHNNGKIKIFYSGTGPFNMQLFKEGLEVKEDKHLKFTVFNDYVVIYFREALKTDEGKYKMVVKNDSGQADAQFVLKVTETKKIKFCIGKEEFLNTTVPLSSLTDDKDETWLPKKKKAKKEMSKPKRKDAS